MYITPNNGQKVFEPDEECAFNLTGLVHLGHTFEQIKATILDLSMLQSTLCYISLYPPLLLDLQSLCHC
jgi:hypothetical protein